MKNTGQCRISQLPLFSNYITYLNTKLLANKADMTYGKYMSVKLQEYGARMQYSMPPEINSSRVFHEICEMIGHIEGMSVAQVIEKVAIEAIGQTYQPQPAITTTEKNKGSFFDLNRGAKK